MLSKHIFPHYQIFPAKEGSFHDIRYTTKYIWDTSRRVVVNIWGGEKNGQLCPRCKKRHFVLLENYLEPENGQDYGIATVALLANAQHATEIRLLHGSKIHAATA